MNLNNLNKIRVILLFVAGMLWAIAGMIFSFLGIFVEAILSYILAVLILIYFEQIQLNPKEEQ